MTQSGLHTTREDALNAIRDNRQLLELYVKTAFYSFKRDTAHIAEELMLPEPVIVKTLARLRRKIKR